MKKKILTVQFKHETNSFCPLPANEQAYRNYRHLKGPEVIEKQRGFGTDFGGFIRVFDELDDMELVPSVALYANPSGHVTEDVYDYVTSEVLKVIEEQGPFDGVLCDVHGAMVADGHPDGEGDLFEIIREKVGWDIPLMAPLDLHANVTAKMARCANALIPFEKYPHTDILETGVKIARLMADTLNGILKPTMAYRYIPFLLPFTPHEAPALAPLYKLAEELKQRSGALNIGFTHGFFPADIEEMGMSVLIITNNDQELAESLADEMKAAIEKALPQFKSSYISLDDALDLALEPGDGPVVLADTSDNPGGGAVSDSTHILRRILERGITGAAIACIRDAESVKRCIAAGVGSTLELDLGGWSDPVYSGGPIHVTAYIRSISDGQFRYKGPMTHGGIANHGPTAVLEIAGNLVLVTSLPRQPYDLEIFRSNGISPEEQKILVTKSAIHYRASFQTIARQMIPLALPGYAVPVPDGYIFQNWKEKV